MKTLIKNSKVSPILEELENSGVKYLEFDAYNEEEYSEKYQDEYIDLFEEVVVNHIFKHFNIDPQNNATIVNYFAKENGRWYVSFYEPDELIGHFDKILVENYSELSELQNW